MTIRLVLILTLILGSLPAFAAKAWVSISTLGMETRQAQALRARVTQQAREVGAEAVGGDDSGCLDDETCTQKRTAELSAHAAIDIRVVLAGDVAQLSIRLLDDKGRLIVRDRSVIEAAELKVGLPEPIVAQLKDLAEKATPPAEGEGEGEGEGELGAEGEGEGELGPEGLPTIGVAGLVVTGVGLTMAVGGLAFAQQANGVVEDPASTGAEKESAFATGWASISVAIVGGLVAATGAGMAFVGFSE